jgi:hypothetical protein
MLRLGEDLRNRVMSSLQIEPIGDHVLARTRSFHGRERPYTQG